MFGEFILVVEKIAIYWYKQQFYCSKYIDICYWTLREKMR